LARRGWFGSIDGGCYLLMDGEACLFGRLGVKSDGKSIWRKRRYEVTHFSLVSPAAGPPMDWTRLSIGIGPHSFDATGFTERPVPDRLPSFSAKLVVVSVGIVNYTAQLSQLCRPPLCRNQS
jgi:hypothetical protein